MNSTALSPCRRMDGGGSAKAARSKRAQVFYLAGKLFSLIDSLHLATHQHIFQDRPQNIGKSFGEPIQILDLYISLVFNNFYPNDIRNMAF
jgi:hypothetical protein